MNYDIKERYNLCKKWSPNIIITIIVMTLDVIFNKESKIGFGIIIILGIILLYLKQGNK